MSKRYTKEAKEFQRECLCAQAASERAWAEMRHRYEDLRRILNEGPTKPSDDELIVRAVTVVCAQVLLNRGVSVLDVGIDDEDDIGRLLG